MPECLISFTKRESKIRTSVDTFFLLTDINTSFSSSSAISFCLNAVNDDIIDSTVLKTKLAVDAKNFLSRPRPRLIDSVSTIESVCSGIDSTDESDDDSADDEIDDSIDDSVDENDNSSLLSA